MGVTLASHGAGGKGSVGSREDIADIAGVILTSRVLDIGGVQVKVGPCDTSAF